jgi:hypothetical protein
VVPPEPTATLYHLLKRIMCPYILFHTVLYPVLSYPVPSYPVLSYAGLDSLIVLTYHLKNVDVEVTHRLRSYIYYN